MTAIYAAANHTTIADANFLLDTERSHISISIMPTGMTCPALERHRRSGSHEMRDLLKIGRM
jgi:hypothetical protein